MACESGWSAPPPAPWIDAGEEQEAEGGGGSAGKAGDGEDGDAGHEEALAAEVEGEPVAGGEDDGVGDEVAGEDPGGFVGGGGERAGDVGERDGGDGGVEHLHEGGEHDGRGDEPGVDALGDLGGLVGWGDGSRGHAARRLLFPGDAKRNCMDIEVRAGPGDAFGAWEKRDDMLVRTGTLILSGQCSISTATATGRAC